MFLKLRVLSYLAAHAGESAIPMAAIVAAFRESFGLSEVVIEDAILQLAVEPPKSGALLRVVDDGTDRRVVFLPAGSVFMSHIIYSCDFLSWLYDKSTNDALPIVADDPINYQQVKLDKASYVLGHKLLRLFALEHPYARVGRNGNVADALRLHQYSNMFGFGPGNWFINQLLNELETYQGKRTLDDTALKETRNRVLDMSRRLDSLYRLA